MDTEVWKFAIRKFVEDFGRLWKYAEGFAVKQR